MLVNRLLLLFEVIQLFMKFINLILPEKDPKTNNQTNKH